MGVVEQRRIEPRAGVGRLHRRLHERDVAPAGAHYALARFRQHLRADLDADHAPGGPDRLHQQRQRQAGTAGDVEHGLPGSEPEQADDPLAQARCARSAGVVARGMAAVLGEGQLGVGMQRRLYG